MAEVSNQNNKHQEDGEEQLAVLIKEAGEEARVRKRKAMEQHFKKLRAVIAEGVSRWQESKPK